MATGGSEGIGLLVGHRSASSQSVTEAVIPAQTGVRTDEGISVWVDEEELHRLNVWLSDHGLRLLGQIHSHPSSAYHSSTDIDFAIAAAEGSFSIVVPDFAVSAIVLERCAVFELVHGTWRQITKAEIREMFKVI